jgi:homocysteine S-methyltransferase
VSIDAWLQRESGVLVLDGGLATELERRGHDVSGPLWSAQVLLDAPEAVEQLHYDYFAAGAHCVIAATYQASYQGFAAAGLTNAETTSVLEGAVGLALAARARFELDRPETSSPGPKSAGASRYVAASVGPYGATLHDGSEYHGNYGLGISELCTFHGPRLDVLASTDADVLACETIPSLDEARALAALLGGHSAARAWVSFTSPDGRHTAHGEPLAECARLLDDIVNVVAVGVNCLRPSVVTEAIAQLKQATGKPIVVYPNSGERWDARARHWMGGASHETLAGCAATWRDAGARLIGGCCRTGPEDIEALSLALEG